MRTRRYGVIVSSVAVLSAVFGSASLPLTVAVWATEAPQAGARLDPAAVRAGGANRLDGAW